MFFAPNAKIFTEVSEKSCTPKNPVRRIVDIMEHHIHRESSFNHGVYLYHDDDPTPQFWSFLCHFRGVVPNFAFNKVVPP